MRRASWLLAAAPAAVLGDGRLAAADDEHNWLHIRRADGDDRCKAAPVAARSFAGRSLP